MMIQPLEEIPDIPGTVQNPALWFYASFVN